MRYKFYEGDSDNCDDSTLFSNSQLATKESISKIESPKIIKIFQQKYEIKTPSYHKTVTLIICDRDVIIDTKTVDFTMLRGFLTIIPIVILLLSSFILKNALISLCVGLYSISLFITGDPYNAFLTMIDYLVTVLSKPDNVKIVLLIFFMSGFIKLIQNSGGTEGLTTLLTSYSNSRRKAQLITYIFGISIFIDDFFSILVVGSNMRPITDLLLISREKLTFLVHATSSPITSICFLSSWVGFEIGLIKRQIKAPLKENEFFIHYLKSLPTRYFPLFLHFFIIIALLFDYDFGPMLKAERKALLENSVSNLEVEKDDKVEPDANIKEQKWYNAIVPICSLILTVFIGFSVSCIIKYYQDPNSGFSDALASVDIIDILLYSTLFTCIITMIFYTIQKLMSFNLALSTFLLGIQDIVETFLILTFAWSIGDAIDNLQTSQFIVSLFEGIEIGNYLPTLAFILSLIISFATGTSWGTVSVMYPLIIPMCYQNNNNVASIFEISIGAIMSGAVFGDLCSPISGTTFLSVSTCKCDLQKHIRTQLPYAIIIIFVSLFFGYLPGAFWFGYCLYGVALLVGTIVLLLLVAILGTKVDSDKLGYWDKFANILGSKFSKDIEANELLNDI